MTTLSQNLYLSSSPSVAWSYSLDFLPSTSKGIIIIIIIIICLSLCQSIILLILYNKKKLKKNNNKLLYQIRKYKYLQSQWDMNHKQMKASILLLGCCPQPKLWWGWFMLQENIAYNTVRLSSHSLGWQYHITICFLDHHLWWHRSSDQTHITSCLTTLLPRNCTTLDIKCHKTTSQ